MSFAPQILLSPFSGNSWSTNGVYGGYFTTNPNSGLHEGQLVLLGQFTLPQEDEFTLQGGPS